MIRLQEVFPLVFFVHNVGLSHYNFDRLVSHWPEGGRNPNHLSSILSFR